MFFLPPSLIKFLIFSDLKQRNKNQWPYASFIPSLAVNMFRGRSKSGSKAGKGKGKARPRDPSPVESSHDSCNGDEINSATTCENSAECGTVVTPWRCPQWWGSFQCHTSVKFLHQRKKIEITTNLTDVQQDMMAIPIRYRSRPS